MLTEKSVLFMICRREMGPNRDTQIPAHVYSTILTNLSQKTETNKKNPSFQCSFSIIFCNSSNLSSFTLFYHRILSFSPELWYFSLFFSSFHGTSKRFKYQFPDKYHIVLQNITGTQQMLYVCYGSEPVFLVFLFTNYCQKTKCNLN